MAVEWTVVEALGLEEDHRIVVLDGGDQQTLGIIGIGGHDRLQAAHVGEERLGTLRVRLGAEDAAARRHANGDRRREIARGAMPQASGLRDHLVVGRIHVVGELDLDARPQAIGGHADGRADDAALVDRRVEAARTAIFLLQSLGAAEDAAEIANVLAKHDHVVVARHHHVMCVANGLDHRHSGHGSEPRFLPLTPQMRRHLLEHIGEHVACARP